MSNTLSAAKDLSPNTVNIVPALTNALTTVFGAREPGGAGVNWVSEPFHCPGVPGKQQGSGSVTFVLDLGFGGGTITILPEHAPPNADGAPPANADFYPMARLTSTNEAENDTVDIVEANLPAGQLKLDLPLSVPSSHWIRLRAVSAAGGGTLQARVTAGRS